MDTRAQAGLDPILLPEPNIASPRRNTRFLHHNTAAARLFAFPAIIR